jgi:methylated-DNA-[protein]-cysteine S-methyltransferase
MEVQTGIRTKAGFLYLTASDKGLTGVYWRKQRVPLGDSKFFKQAERELLEYFEGRRQRFTVALDFAGTKFQMKVWRQLAKIPYGKTISYTDLAAKIGQPLAVRAVGAANGRNPLSIFLPCHRVVSSSGKLTGYSGGLKAKAMLLELESARE